MITTTLITLCTKTVTILYISSSSSFFPFLFDPLFYIYRALDPELAEALRLSMMDSNNNNDNNNNNGGQGNNQ